MTTIGLYSIKGGVGKTAACVNLAFLASEEGKRTLLSDLDPQGSATFTFRIRPSEDLTSKVFLLNRKKRDQAIRATDHALLDVLPGVLSYRRMDIRLDRLNHRKHRLHRLFREYGKIYDWIFLDCPPNITLVSENIFSAVDILLVPVIPTTLSIWTLEHLVGFFAKKHLPPEKIIPFFSMVEKKKALHRSIMEQYSAGGCRFLKTVIPYSNRIESMGLTRKPVVLSHPRSAAASAYRSLWNEIKQQLS